MVGVIAKDLRILKFYSEEFSGSGAGNLTLFCDFDGPIIDVSERYYTTYQLGLADTQAFYQSHTGTTLPIQVLSKEQFWSLKRDRVSDCEIATRSGLHPEQIEVFLAQVHRIVNQPVLLQQDHLQPEARWALHWLHASGVKLVLVTLRCQTQAAQILKNYGLAHLFTRICGMPDSSAAYQNYAGFKAQLLTDLLAEGIWQTDSACIVGDTEADILAGQAVGIPTIAVTCGIRSQLYLKKYQPTHICSDLRVAASSLLKCCQSAVV
jgi:phosphoglycolate phosphatase